MSAKTKKAQLFEVYSQNLQYVRNRPEIELEPDFEEGVVCPQCFRLFDKSALVQVGNLNCLTLEHIPPRGITSNSITILTCKECNDSAGHSLDIDLKKEQEVLDFLNMVPGSKTDTLLTIDNTVKLRGTTVVTEKGKIKIHIDDSRTSPMDLSGLEEKAKSGMRDSDINFRSHSYRKRRPEIALLRIAYLLSFSKFGNGFLINPALGKVREQIKYPEKIIIPHLGRISPTPDALPVGYYIVNDPLELKSFLIVFQIKARKYYVILPGPTHPGIDVYEHMKVLMDQKRRIDFNTKPIPEAPFLTEESYALAPYDLFGIA